MHVTSCIKIVSPKLKCVINPANKVAQLMQSKFGWKLENYDVAPMLQSQLTDSLIKQLVDTGTCMLPSYEESAKLHVPLIKCFLEHLNNHNHNDEEVTICPIT